MARGAGGALLAQAVEPWPRRRVRRRAPGAGPRAPVMVVEDGTGPTTPPWTWSAILAWRIPALPSVLLLTYRDDELRDDHPLRRVLGGLASRDVPRLLLRPLSSGAVEELAGAHGADAGAVLAATAGNPFFVTEVLSNPGPRCRPRSGCGAGPARRPQRAHPAGPGAARPSLQAERWLVEALLGGDTTALDEAERRGVLEADPGHVCSATSWPAGRSSRRRSSTARSPATGGSWPSRSAARGRAVAAVPPRPPGRRPRGGRPLRLAAASARRPAPAPSPRPWPTTSWCCAGRASCRTPSGRPCWRRASGCSTTSPASTRRWPAPARWSPCASGPATRPRSGRPSPPCRDALHGERPGRFRAGRDPRRCPAGPGARRPAPAGPPPPTWPPS